MQLIADSGSTNTSWVLIDGNGDQYFNTEGYNPFFVDSDYIQKSLKISMPNDIDPNSISKVDFYGAGCTGKKVNIIADALQCIFINSTVNVEVDLLASARSLLGRSPGFAAILGTGTNTCIYDGEKIGYHIDSLGHILGDEGSGSYIGKTLIREYLRGTMPKAIRDQFDSQYNLPHDELMASVYNAPLVNRYCAGFTKFLTPERIKDDYLYALVKRCFEDLFINLVSKYPDFEKYTFNCVGSIGYNFSDILSDVARKFNMQTGNIISSPMEGLVKYHSKI